MKDAVMRVAQACADVDAPYWERVGRTYIDRAGGRVVLQNAAWSA